MDLSSFFKSPRAVFSAAVVLRAVFFFYGLFQDAHSPMKYTDIDYYVFTDAARFLSLGQSPYDRDTYRYTPLLAWLIYPTTWPGAWFSFGKVLFAVGDVVAGWMMFRILCEHRGMEKERALKFASIWLLNPMVATISTRGSSEGLLGVFVTALLWAVLAKKIFAAGLLLGFAVHFKIYPFIYAASIVWWLDDTKVGKQPNTKPTSLMGQIFAFVNPQRIALAIYSLLTFIALNVVMYQMYGQPFLEHTYFYHLTRLDHRHNFSPYNTLLYLNSSPKVSGDYPFSVQDIPATADKSFEFERLAFVPQLLLSAVMIPLVLAKKDLPTTMLAQTFAFVAFNKVCTSQYFLWYMMFLPYYLPNSTLLRSKRVGITALALWLVTQAYWLQQAFMTEFKGRSRFAPDLWLASLAFFVVNVGILGVIIDDTKTKTHSKDDAGKKKA